MVKLNDPQFSEILDWLEGKLPEDEAQVMAEKLASADEATQADLEWLRDFLQTSQSVRLASPPPRVREALRRRFTIYAESRQPPNLLQRLQAKLAFDSHAQLAVAGLRSTVYQGKQRQLVYETDIAEIALNIQPRAQEQRFDLFGQIFPKGNIPANGFGIQLLEEDGLVEQSVTTSDDLGEFKVEDIPQGRYGIFITTEGFAIVLPSVHLRL